MKKIFSRVSLLSGILAASAVAEGEVWQIDFQGGQGGAFGSADPVTATVDLGDGPQWNAFEVAATNAGVFAKPPSGHNASTDPKLASLRRARGGETGVGLFFTGRVSAYNVNRTLKRGELDQALGDHWFWGAQGQTDRILSFEFRGLPAGTYDLQVFANPDRHNPPRDFALRIGEKRVEVKPQFEGQAVYAKEGTFSQTITRIEVGKEGILKGKLETVAKDPSLAAMILKRRE